MKAKTFIFACAIQLILLTNLAVAAPSLTIHSPTNGTSYYTPGIPLNVTSDEVSDFYTLSNSGRRHYLAYNTTSYEAMLYQKAGDYAFTIYANSSSGEGIDTVYYSSTVHNPIEIGECGFIQSGDTKYVLVNNISAPYCLVIEEVSNISIDLNGFTLNGEGEALIAGLVEQAIIENGTISSDSSTIYMEYVNGIILRDLYVMTGYMGFHIEGYADALFDNDVFGLSGTEETGIALVQICDSCSIHMRDTVLEDIEEMFHLPYSEYGAAAFYEIYENVTFLLPDGAEEFNFLCLESSQCNLAFVDSDYSSALFVSDGYGGNIIVTEHSRLDVLTTDQEEQGVPAALEINTLSPFEYNPTKRVLSSTEYDGFGSIYLSNRLSVYKEGENNLVMDEEFPSYSVTARFGTTEQNSNVTFTSPAQINFTFTVTTPAAYILVDSCDTLDGGYEYRLDQNITADQDPCITVNGESDVIFNLDGYSIDGYGGNAVLINNSQTVDITNGFIKNCSDGISSKDSSDLTIQDMEITQSIRGVQLEQVNDSIIQDNTIGYNGIGINMASSHDVTLISNTFNSNTENVVIDPSQDIIFIRNLIQAAEIGLRLIDIINSAFVGDIFTGNNDSIILNNSANIDFVRTNISSISSDLRTFDSSVSFSGVSFNENKVEELGDSALYGFFPPACIYGVAYTEGESICNGTIILDMELETDLKVLSGDTCYIKDGVTVTGDINVQGGTLDITESTIIGDIKNGTSSLISLKGPGTEINGNIIIEGSSELLIKEINVTGNISSSGSDTVILKDNFIGGSILSTDDETVVIKGNSVYGDISIINPVSCDEKQNTVGGTNSGCS